MNMERKSYEGERRRAANSVGVQAGAVRRRYRTLSSTASCCAATLG